MHQLLYVSNTARNVEQSWLDAILKTSRRNNALLGVTGLLLYADGGFLQILEGETQVVQDLYKKISQDKRHWNAQLLMRLDAPPAFEDWSMGFQRVTREVNSEIFEISSAAIGGHLSSNDAKVLLTLAANFYRIQTGTELGDSSKP